MNARLRRIVYVLGVAATVPVALAPAASAQSDGSPAQLPPGALVTAPPEVRLIAENGFGDPRNVYSWSMARFRGRIYVGTGRLVVCVENQTVDFFLRVSDRYVTNPLPGATCPPDPYDMDLRAEIWEYTPWTGKWRRVYRSRADVPNPRARGKFVSRDIAFRGMTVFRDARGRKRLYAGGVTADEYLPELKRKYPPRILSTRDGRHWRATPAHDVVVRMPYGIFRPMGFRSLRVWRGRMYMTVTPGLTGDGAIFEVKRPWSPRRVRFRQITPNTMAVFEIENFDGALYAGTGDRERGYGVYRISRNRSRYRFHPIVTHGAGRGQTVTSVVSMHVFKGWLYVGSSGWYNEESNPVSEIIRIDRAGGWQVVTGPGRTVRGRPIGPISGLSDGFNNVFSAHFWRMANYRGELVVGTNDWAYLTVLAYPGLEPWAVDVVEFVLTGERGFDLWASCDGVNWRVITRDAFGGNRYDFGARNLIPGDDRLYVGSANHAQGTRVWSYRGNGCPGTSTAAGAAAKSARRPPIPQALMTDVQKDGTVISWRSAAAATGTRYLVMRATYTDVQLGLSPPAVMASGFSLEGALPRVGAPGAGGSNTADLPVTKGFVTIGTTDERFFVDRTARRGARYAYQVVAEAPSGARSAASNVQAVPDPRPEPALAAARLHGAAARMSRVAGNASARRATLRRIARLRRAARPGSDRRLLLERLERRVRYAGIAEGG
jgi:hypothetical protein